MTDALRRVRSACAIAALALLAAGCFGGDDPALLDSDALPSDVSSSSSGHAGFPGVTGCSDLVDQQDFASTDAWAGDGYEYWTYRLRSGDNVGAAVLDFRDAQHRDAAVEKITNAINDCAADPKVGIEVAPLDGLPEGSFGYRATEPWNDTEKRGSMVFSPAGGDRLVAVGVWRHDGTDPKADVMRLVDTAVDRAADLEDLPTNDQAGG